MFFALWLLEIPNGKITINSNNVTLINSKKFTENLRRTVKVVKFAF